jgi:hypothetical protein
VKKSPIEKESAQKVRKVDQSTVQGPSIGPKYRAMRTKVYTVTNPLPLL